MVLRRPDEVVGRDPELVAIDGFLDGVAKGEAAPLVIEGEPGLGKTILWEAGVDSADRRSFAVLKARPAEPESRLSYAGLADLLAGLPDDIVPSLPVPQSRALGVALLRVEPDGPPPDQMAVGTAVLSALRALAARGPVLVAVDDLQWLDPPSFHALQFALRRTGNAPVGLLATRRTEVARPRENRAGPSIAGATRMALDPMSLGALRRLLATRLGPAFSHTTLLRIRQATGGNPFFALEIGRMLQRTGATVGPGDPLPVPASLHELLRARLAELSPHAQAVLVAASAVSHPTVALLMEIDGDRQNVVAALREATDAHVIHIEDERIRFSHPLLSSVIYMSGSSSDRYGLHDRLARVVKDPEDRARHLAIAVQGTDEEAAAACEEGAQTGWARAAPHSAAHLAVRALELTPPSDAEALLRRSLAAAQYLYDSGDTDLARQLLRARVAALAAGPSRARALYRLAVVEGELGPARDSIKLFEQALAESSVETPLAIRIAIDLAWMESWGGSVVTAAERAHEALRLAEELGHENLIGQALVAVAVLDQLCGRPPRDDLMRRAIELEHSMPEVPLDRAPSAAYGLQLTRRGYLDAARPLFERVLQLAVERGEETNLSAMSFYLSGLEWLAGNWGRADEHIERGTELATLTGVNRQEMLFSEAMLVAHRGRLDEARAKAERGLGIARESAEPLAVSRFLATLGFIELTLGRHEAARTVIGEARATLTAMGMQEPGAFRFLPDLVEACLATGAISEAREMTSWLEDRADPVDHPWAAAASARCRGLIQFADADPEAATESLNEAISRYRKLPMPFEAARSAMLLGQGQRRLKLKRAARDSLQQALDVFEKLGAAAWAERARSELGRIGGRPSSPFELTPSELQVATLVASGRSNREVAEALHMTVNTVETNLSRIYRKLRVRSRSELGATLRGERTTSSSAVH